MNKNLLELIPGKMYEIRYNSDKSMCGCGMFLYTKTNDFLSFYYFLENKQEEWYRADWCSFSYETTNTYFKIYELLG